MKIGLFGGAFNPTHIGHLNTANEVMWKAGLDRVYFVLSARPPHKKSDDLIDVEARYEMLRLACGDNPCFIPARIEMERPGASYTIDTVSYFKENVDENISWIIGQDAMEEIATWRQADDLLKMCDFIVVTRPGYDPTTFYRKLSESLFTKYPDIRLIADGKAQNGAGGRIMMEGADTVITMLSVTALDIASSEIRSRIRRGVSVKYITPCAVEKYLAENPIFGDAKIQG